MVKEPEPAPVIGIVGGLGPHAHVELERLLLAEVAARHGPGLRDQDYPEWIVSSIPSTPDRTAALLGEGPSPVPALQRSLDRLARAGAGFAIIPCNTAHAYLDVLQDASVLPILDMISLTIARAIELVGAGARVGLLATTGTCQARVYHRRAADRRRPLELVTLLDLPGGVALQDQLVMTPIYGELVDGRRVGGIKSGVEDAEHHARLRRAVARLAAAGAELVILGCTELPLSLGREAIDGTPLLDPMQVLAQRAIDACLARQRG